jgi:hypothetical protein
MSLNKLKVSLVLLLAGLLAAGAGLLAYQAAVADQPDGRPRPQARRPGTPSGDRPKLPAKGQPPAGDGRPQVRQAAVPARREIPAEAIQHWAVAEAPEPRNRTHFGGGEEVDLWVDSKLWKQPGGAIVWRIQGGGTVLPVVGVNSRMTVDLLARDSSLGIEASHQPDEPAQAPAEVNLSRWLNEQLRDMPKRAHRPAAKISPDEPEANRPELRAVLNKLDGYRTDRNGSLTEMDQLAGKLLRGFRDPVERGQIYYHLAHVHGQSGLHFPEKVMEYAGKALELPLQPGQRFTLYVYWGDAHRVAKRPVPPAEKRRWAAGRYLEGLKLLLPYRLPEKAPELPVVAGFNDVMPRGDPADPVFIRQLQEWFREKDKYDKAWAARRQAELIRGLIWEREVLAGQIVSLYHPEPAAWGEIRHIASAVLGDRAAVERLLAAVRSGKAWYRK